VTRINLPPQYQRMARAFQELEAAAFIARLVQGRPRILNVGPSWGRDYYSLADAGHQVYNLDIAIQQHLPRLAIANIAQVAPFPDRTFDAVLLPEVLEHIYNDFDALHEARRVLKDDGKLVVTVPFYNDLPDYHVRIHSRKTIQRLLQSSGFEPIEYIERGGLVSFPRVVHGLRKAFSVIGLGESFTRGAIRFDAWLGRRRFLPRRWLTGYGCAIAAVKSEAVDFERLNATAFRH